MMIQNNYLHMKVQFIFDNKMLEGFVVKDHRLEDGLITVQSGNDLYEIPLDDLLDDVSYGFSEETEERFHHWYSEE